MPPFSPTAKGFLPNSIMLFWPENPCQPSLKTHAGSTRPVEPPGPDEPGVVVTSNGAGASLQSAVAQQNDPRTRNAVGTGTASSVLARLAPIPEVPPPVVPS